MKSSTRILIVFFFCIYPGNIQRGNPASDDNIVLKDKCSIAVDTTSSTGFFVRPFNLEIIPPSSGVQFYRNGIIFLSFSKGDERVPEKHLSFGTIKTFMALIADSVPGPYMPFLSTLSTIFPTEATTFTPDFNTMYLSLIPDRSKNEKIFKATFSPKGWVIDNEPLKFCRDNFIYTHPSLSHDDSYMVFASNQTGSVGGLDLFVTRKENGQWTDPENLGKNINSTGNELFASLDYNNNLYYSSDGLPGKGGFDIYMCRYNGHGWDNPVSLPFIINSNEDEVAFTINRDDGSSAFYTLRSRTKNRMELFRVTTEPEPGRQFGSTLTDRFFASQKTTMPISSERTESVNKNEIPITEITEPVSVKEMASTTLPDKQSVENKPESKATAIEPVTELKTENKENLIYRIQILANNKPIGSTDVEISGKKFRTYEYIYQGSYKTTVGEFRTRAEATKFQILCHQNGYNQAFIAAFINDERITDAEARSIELQALTKSAASKSVSNMPAAISKDTETIPSKDKKGLIYRVQILANTRPVGSYNVTVAGSAYKTFEYFYMGGYRTTIGEFDRLPDAVSLQNQCRQSGYNQAFVVAFVNGERTTDPELLKE